MKKKDARTPELKALYDQIAPYAKVLRYASITWMDNKEIGMAPASGRRKPKYPILLWVYKFKNVDEMCATATHEVVHYVHPELETNEPAVDAKALSLMKNPLWEMLVLYKVLHSLHVSVKEAYALNDKFTIG